MSRFTYPSEKQYWRLFSIAALSFIPALFYYYVGEEAIFPISSLEMWERGVWLKQYLYGQDVQHNPLFNWLIIPLSAISGWEYVLIITRGLTVLSTIATGLVLAWLAQSLFGERTFSALVAVSYITMTDISLYHGWLCYVDPLFALLTFSACACLWVASHKTSTGLLILAGLALTAAFLSKAFTAYVFYGACGFVLLFSTEYRRFLLRPTSIAIHLATLAAPLLWFKVIPGGSSQSGRMFAEITDKLSRLEWTPYLWRLVEFPLKTLLWLAPITLLAGYYWFRKQIESDSGKNISTVKIACWMVFLNFLPYWLAPQGSLRYLQPIYPLFALIAARMVWQAGERAHNTAYKWIAGALVLKLCALLIAFPYYERHYRGKNYDETAVDILRITKENSLYSIDVSASGLNVTAYVNQRRQPISATLAPPAHWEDGFVISREPNETLGKIYKKYRLAADNLYLLCRGKACSTPGNQP